MQAQHYAIDADRKAGVLLILENESDEVYIRKLCKRIAEKGVTIDVFVIGTGIVEEAGKSDSCPGVSGEAGTVLEIQS